MEPRIFEIYRNGKFTTVKAQGAVSAACDLYPDIRPPMWRDLADYSSIPIREHVILSGGAGGDVEVREISLNPACV